MIFHEPFFCKRPESFKTIDMGSFSGEFFPMINRQVLAVEFQRVIRFEIVGIKHTSFFRMFFDLIHKVIGGDIVNNSRHYFPLTLKHAENLYFSLRSTTSYPFSFPSKVALITLYLTRESTELLFQIQGNFLTIFHILIPNFIITKTKIFRRLITGFFKTKKNQ